MYMVLNGIEVSVKRKAIKNMHLYVKPPDGHVEVSAPTQLSDESIELFIRTRIGWIRRQQEKFDKQPRQTAREYVSGEALYVWGGSIICWLTTVARAIRLFWMETRLFSQCV